MRPILNDIKWGAWFYLLLMLSLFLGSQGAQFFYAMF